MTGMGVRKSYMGYLLSIAGFAAIRWEIIEDGSLGEGV
jgi:hypothetical protein